MKLEAPVPLDLYLIDLDGGLIGVKPGAHQVTIDQIASTPLRALLKGFLHPDLQAMGPRPIQISGLLSVMREQMLAAPNIEERFGDRSYAIISDKYLNFSSRVGYHYSVLDTYCGQTVNKNYLTFSFQGGAADDLRRHRRVRAIALVLLGLDFSVEVVGRPGGRPFAEIRESSPGGKAGPPGPPAPIHPADGHAHDHRRQHRAGGPQFSGGQLPPGSGGSGEFPSHAVKNLKDYLRLAG